MGLRGPAPTPSRLLALRGSWRGARPGEPQPDVELPPPPDWLGADARSAYDAVGGQLLAQGLVTGLDANSLARYASLWVRYRRCEEFVAKFGEAYPVRARSAQRDVPGEVSAFRTYPQAKQALALAAELLRLEREFGLTPAARARLSSQVEVPEGKETAFDYFGDAQTG